MEVKAAVEAMGRRDIWLAAVMMALKMWGGAQRRSENRGLRLSLSSPAPGASTRIGSKTLRIRAFKTW